VESNLVGFILAGGESKRLRELTGDKPKFFLEINGKRIIDYHLEKLSNLGIKTTYIVLGFLKEMVKETFGNSYQGMNIIYIDNDEFETTGHSYGLFLGRDVFKKNNILLVHADVFCDPYLHDEALKNDFENVVLVDEDYQVLTGDEYVVQGENDVMFGLGPNRSEKIQGEFVGISKFSSEFLTLLCDYMEEFFEKESKKLNYETLIDKFLKETNFKINYKKINGRKWININYIEDYEKAQNIAENMEKERDNRKIKSKQHINL